MQDQEQCLKWLFWFPRRFISDLSSSWEEPWPIAQISINKNKYIADTFLLWIVYWLKTLGMVKANTDHACAVIHMVRVLYPCVHSASYTSLNRVTRQLKFSFRYKYWSLQNISLTWCDQPNPENLDEDVETDWLACVFIFSINLNSDIRHLFG